MWECTGCAYRNEDLDETCARCGVDRVTALADDQWGGPQRPPAGPVAGTPRAGVKLADAADEGRRRDAAGTHDEGYGRRLAAPLTTTSRSRRALSTEALLAVIIVAFLAALGAVGYLAWGRGLLDTYLPERLRYAQAPPGAAATTADAAPGAAGDETPLTEQDILEDPLERLGQAKAPGFGALKPYVKPLREARDVLQQAVFTSGERGVLNPDSLALLEQLATLGDSLTASYREFEAKAARVGGAAAQPLVQLMRDEFMARFIELIDALGEAYSLDEAGRNHAYTLSDDIPRALEELGRLDPAVLREHWQTALHARSQLFLDIKNAESYKQLAARCQALEEVHNEFNAAMASIPAYRTRAGVLDSNGAKALELYDSLAGKIEELALEFDTYCATLDPATDSDKRQQLVARFTDLAQTDHFTCFMETYKVYAMDHELAHEAYTRLIEVHYPFVKEHWPAREPQYQAASLKYEEEWKQRWHKK